MRSMFPSFKWIAPLLVFLTALGLHAQSGELSCTNVDLRIRVGEPRDQGVTGWCFACSAADLISAKLGKRVSCRDLALQSHTVDFERINEIGSREILDFLDKNPEVEERFEEGRTEDLGAWTDTNLFRSNRSLNQHFGILGVGGYEDHAILLGQVNGFCEAAKFGDDASDEFTFASQLDALVPLLRAPDKDVGPATENRARRRLGAMQIDGNNRCGQRIQTHEFFVPQMLVLADDAADYRDQIDKGTLIHVEAQKKIWAEVDAYLDRREVSALGYSVYDTMSPEQQLRAGFSREDDEDHSSIIAARRKVGDTCQYFVRNHWGKNCDLYKEPFRQRCESSHGGFWATPAELSSAYSVIGAKGTLDARRGAFAKASFF